MDRLGLMKTFSLRFLVLAPIAFCIFLVLESEDKMVRLAAVIGLVLLAQLREWLLVWQMGKIRNGQN